MRASFLLFFLLIASCGRPPSAPGECIPREAKILECRAVEAAANYFNTAQMLEAQKEKCEQTYAVGNCF